MYPIMMKLTNKPVVVIGGGKVAARKISGLLQEEAQVTVISPSLHAAIDPATVRWRKKRYETGDLQEAALIFACTNNDQVNEQVLQDAKISQWVNVTSNKKVAEFYNMATTRVGDLSVSVSTHGQDPMRAKQIRRQLENYLTELEN